MRRARLAPPSAVRVLALVVFGIAALSCSEGPTEPSVPVVAVDISGAPASGVILVGGSVPLSATPRGASGQALNRSVQWLSSNTAIATVSATGVVSGVAAGPVAILASSGGIAGAAVLSIRVGIAVPAAGAPGPTTTSVLDGAVSLTIPPGATTAPQLTVAPAADVPNDTRVLAGTTFDFGPSGTVFSAPVTMSLRYQAASVPAPKRQRLRIHRIEADGSATLLPDGVVDEANARVSAPVSSFSTYALLVPADVASLVILEGNSQAAYVGTAVQGMSLLALDAQQRPVPLVQIGFSVQSGGGSIDGPTSVMTGANGVATFPSSWILGPAKGQQTLRATIVGDGRFVTFTATATAPATTLQLVGAPNAGVSGVTLPEPIVVQVLDDFGDPVTEIGRTVTARLVEGTGTLLGDSIMDAPTGSAIFQNLRIAGSGAHRIAFVSGTLAPDTTAAIEVTQVLGSLAIVTQPAGAQSGVPFATQPVIELRDNAGLLLAGGSDTIVASAVHGPGLPIGGLAAAAVNGVATFSGLGIEGPGAQRLRFSAGLVDVISDEITVGPQPEGVWMRVGLVPRVELIRGQGYGPDIVVDLSNRGTANIARLQVEITWDPTRLEYLGRSEMFWADSTGANATITADESRVAEGVLQFTGETSRATIATFVLQRLTLRVKDSAPPGTTLVGANILEALNDGGASVPITVRSLSLTIASP